MGRLLDHVCQIMAERDALEADREVPLPYLDSLLGHGENALLIPRLKKLFGEVEKYAGLDVALMRSLSRYFNDEKETLVLNVLEFPGKDNIVQLVAAAKAIDSDYVKIHGSVQGLLEACGMTCVQAIFVFLKALSSIIAPFFLGLDGYKQWINESVAATQSRAAEVNKAYEKLTYHKVSITVCKFTSFFKLSPLGESDSSDNNSNEPQP